MSTDKVGSDEDEELAALRMAALATLKSKPINPQSSLAPIPVTQTTKQPNYESNKNTLNQKQYTVGSYVSNSRQQNSQAVRWKSGRIFQPNSSQRSNLIVINTVPANEGSQEKVSKPLLILPQHRWCQSGNEDSSSPKSYRRTGPSRFNRHESGSEDSDTDFEKSDDDSNSSTTFLQDEQSQNLTPVHNRNSEERNIEIQNSQNAASFPGLDLIDNNTHQNDPRREGDRRMQNFNSIDNLCETQSKNEDPSKHEALQSREKSPNNLPTLITFDASKIKKQTVAQDNLKIQDTESLKAVSNIEACLNQNRSSYSGKSDNFTSHDRYINNNCSGLEHKSSKDKISFDRSRSSSRDRRSRRDRYARHYSRSSSHSSSSSRSSSSDRSSNYNRRCYRSQSSDREHKNRSRSKSREKNVNVSNSTKSLDIFAATDEDNKLCNGLDSTAVSDQNQKSVNNLRTSPKNESLLYKKEELGLKEPHISSNNGSVDKSNKNKINFEHSLINNTDKKYNSHKDDKQCLTTSAKHERKIPYKSSNDRKSPLHTSRPVKRKFSRSSSKSSSRSSSYSSSSSSPSPKIRSVSSVIQTVQSRIADPNHNKLAVKSQVSPTFNTAASSSKVETKCHLSSNQTSHFAGAARNHASESTKRVPVHMRLGKRVIKMTKDVEAAFQNSSSEDELEVNKKSNNKNVKVMNDLCVLRNNVLSTKDFKKKVFGKFNQKEKNKILKTRR